MNVLRSFAAALALGLLAGPALAQTVIEPPCQFTCGFTVLPPDELTGDETFPADLNLDDGTARSGAAISVDSLGAPSLYAAAQYTSIPIGSVAYGSLGTNTTPVAGTQYLGLITIPVPYDITAIACMNGGTAGTDKLIYGLWSASGTLLANTALAGVTASGTDAFQSIATTETYSAAPGLYYVGWQTNGTTTRFRTVAASTYLTLSTSDTGTFGTLETITIPGTFTADKAPICYVTGTLSTD